MLNIIRKKIIKFLLNDDETIIDSFEKMQFDATVQSLKKINSSHCALEMAHEIDFILHTIFNFRR